MTQQATGDRPATGKRGHAAGTARMVVAVEASRLAREVRGIGRYVRALLPRLLAEREGLELVLYVRNMQDADAVRAIFEPSLHPRVEVRPMRTMTRSGADVFWFPWNTTGPTPRTGCVVVTMHDVVPIAHPDPRSRGTYKYLRWKIKFQRAAARTGPHHHRPVAVLGG